MKNAFIILTALFLSGNILAQKEDPNHWNVYEVPKEASDDNYTVTLTDAVANAVESKLRVTIKNNTSDYLIFEESKCTFKLPTGDKHPKKKKHVIKPNAKKGFTVGVSGEADFHVDNYNFGLDGLSKAPQEGTVHQAEEFQLPVAKNEFTVGPYHVKCKGAELKTQESKVYFIVTYQGKDIGLFNGSKLVVKIPNGTEYANNNKNLKTKMMEPGDKERITAVFNVPGRICDMQFETMYILWKDCFIESVAVPIEGKSFEMNLDAGLTEEKNK